MVKEKKIINDQSQLKNEIKTSENVKPICANVNIPNEASSCATSLTNEFIDDELDKNINNNLLPNTDTLEEVLNHFNHSIHHTSVLSESLNTLNDVNSAKTTASSSSPAPKIAQQEKLSASSSSISSSISEKPDFYDFFNSILPKLLQKRIDKLNMNHPIKKQFTKSTLSTLAININEHVLKIMNPNGDSHKKYFNRMSKIKNMIDPDESCNQNSQFYMKILSGKLKPDELASMSDEELLREQDSETSKLDESEIVDTNNSTVIEDLRIQGDSDEDLPLAQLSKMFQIK